LVAYLLPLNLALDIRHCDERLTMGRRQFRLAAASEKQLPNFRIRRIPERRCKSTVWATPVNSRPCRGPYAGDMAKRSNATSAPDSKCAGAMKLVVAARALPVNVLAHVSVTALRAWRVRCQYPIPTGVRGHDRHIIIARIWLPARAGAGWAYAESLAPGADRGYLRTLRLPSSSGPGRRPLTAKTGVRVP
jgi:hypothetical protein